MSDEGQPTDLRARRRREQRRMLWIVIGFLVIVGSVVIGVVYGPFAVLLGLLVLLAGAALLGLIWLLLTWIERWARR